MSHDLDPISENQVGLTEGTEGRTTWPDSQPPGPEWQQPPSRPDSALNRIRFGWVRVGRTIDPQIRRLQGLELLVVLALFPLTSTYAAVADLTQRIQSGYPVVAHSIPPIYGTWMPVGFGIARQLIELTPVLLIWYLLTRSGEGLRAINLGERRLRMDLALVLPIYVVVMWLPQLIGGHVLSAAGLHTYYLIPTPVPLPSGALTIEWVIASAVAGVLEEVVILGYLVRRLEQRGYGVAVVIIIDVVARVSYHLYYGWGALSITCWALVSVVVYLRVRRLLPLILCHIIWDAAFPFRAFYHGAYQIMQAIAFILGIALMCMWGRWSPDRSAASETQIGSLL